MIIIFDFDKTLTDYDTLLGFYRSASNSKGIFAFKKLIFSLFSLCYKLKIINNDVLKSIGIIFFLYGKQKKEILKIAKEYSKNIKLNKLYYNNFMDSINSNKVLVVSASFEEYLIHLFPQDILIASQIKYSSNGRVVGLERNIYGEKKKIALAKNNIKNIDILYTDNLSDKPLMEISKTIYLIKNGEIFLVKNNLISLLK